MACGDLQFGGLLVHASLATQLELEVLHRIRDVSGFSIDPRCIERPIQQFPRGSDERLSEAVLLIARLLADE
jgi:hypothetical protein